MGSGEGALSGDSYYGDGVYKSADGGVTWSHVSGGFFPGSSVSDIVVDPANANHLYIATLRGRGGIRRTTPPSSQPYGIWESTDGGVEVDAAQGHDQRVRRRDRPGDGPARAQHPVGVVLGRRDLPVDQRRQVLVERHDGSLPQGQFLPAPPASRSASRTCPATYPVLYTGFDYFDKKGAYHPSSLWRNDSGGLAWKHLPTGGPTSDPDSILDYCTTQCFYDNVVTPDPTNPDIVYVAGSYGYDQSPQSGGIYRSTDGGQTWKSLGYDLHPDFHAIAFEPDNTEPRRHRQRRRRLAVEQQGRPARRRSSRCPRRDWENLNGTVDPTTARWCTDRPADHPVHQHRQRPHDPRRPGTGAGPRTTARMRKSTANATRWFDQASGDGGQVLVDPNDSGYSYGTYTALTPYRYDPDNQLTTFGNQFIDGGINTKDRAEFYVPWVMNKGNTNQLFLGSYRLYRTDNAKAPVRG